MNPEFLNNTTVGSAGSVSDSGWSNTSIFQEYLLTHFFRYAQGSAAEYKLILYDGHKIIIIIVYLYSAQYLHILQDSKRYLTNPTVQVQPQLTSN